MTVVNTHRAEERIGRFFRGEHHGGHASRGGEEQVSASSSVKKVAGKLAHSAREGEPPAVLAIGADSLNQAIKVRRRSATQCCP